MMIVKVAKFCLHIANISQFYWLHAFVIQLRSDQTTSNHGQSCGMVDQSISNL